MKENSTAPERTLSEYQSAHQIVQSPPPPPAERLAARGVAEVDVVALDGAADIARDPQYKARGMFEEVQFGGRPLKIPAMVPKLSDTPGSTTWAGPAIGAHNREVLREVLGLTDAEIDRLAKAGVI